MVCFDTDFLVALTRGRSEAARKAEDAEAEGLRKTTTPVSAFELYLGAHLSERRERNLELVSELLYSLEILDFDEPSCDAAGSVVADLMKLGKPIGARDAMIAGMALRHEQTLVTRNTEHFSRVKGLRISTW